MKASCVLYLSQCMAVPFGDQIHFAVNTSYHGKKARMWKTKPGEKVLVIGYVLLYASNKLMQWKGRYQIGIKTTKVDYQFDVKDKVNTQTC